MNQALAGNSGVKVIRDYNGNPVISAYAPVEAGNSRWAICVEIDVAEAFVPMNEKGDYVYDRYVDLYGYYDLFLIDNEGYCYFTAAKEADYKSNFVNGRYRNSNMGKLVQRVLETKRFGFADFEPYEPSDNQACSFIAVPILNRSNDILTVVGLQMSLESINAITQVNDGMGESGETYLVGPNNRMRSDSIQDPTGHSVKASFAGTVKDNGVDTAATREALAGNDGHRIIEDYRGVRVLSSFTNVDVSGTKCALIA